MGISKAGLISVEYKAIFDASGDAAFILDETGHILDANRVAIKRYGYSLEEFTRLTAAELAPPDLKRKVMSKINQAITSGGVFEWRHKCKDGRELPVEIYTHPLVLHGRKVILSRVRDISKRKKLEIELQNKNHFLEHILDTEPGTVYIFDLAGQHNVYVNKHWLAAYGYSAEETQAMGADLIKIFHPDDLPEINAHHEAWREASDEETRTIEYRIRDKQGNWQWLSSLEKPFNRNSDGSVSQILGIAHDVTELKNIVQERDKAQRAHLMMLESMTDGFVELDKNWCYRYLNKKAADFFGREQQSLIGKHIWTEFPEGVGQPFHLNYVKAMVEQRVICFEEYYAPWNRWFENRVYPSADGLIILFQEITERKRAEILLGGQSRVLELIAIGTPLPETLDALIRLVEEQSPGMLGSILLLDADGIHVRHGAAPNLPAAFVAAIDGQPIGLQAGSCGTAAFRKQAVYVEDIGSDPLWEKYKAAALQHGLHACWSTPIIDAQGAVLGTFAMYYRQPGLPSPEHIQLIDLVTHVASIAIVCHRTDMVMRESEAKYRSIIDASPVAMAINEEHQKVTLLNSKFIQTFGYTLADIPTLAEWWVLAYPDAEYRQRVRQEWKAAVEKAQHNVNEFEPLEYRVACKDGSVRDIRFSMAPLGSATLVILYDLTEYRLAERALRNSEGRLAKAQTMAHVGFMDWDFKTKTVFCSEVACKMLGIAGNARLVPEDDVWGSVHPDDVVNANKSLELALQGVKPYRFDHRFKHADGTVIWVHAQADIALDADGHAEGFLETLIDITERKLAEETLRENEAMLAKAEQVAHIGHCTFEVASSFIHWSEELWHIFGRDAASFKLTYDSMLSWLRPDFRAYHNVLMQRMLDLKPGDAMPDFGYCLLRPDGTERWVEGVLETTFDDNGKPKLFFGTVQDITARKEGEDRLQRLTQLYAALSQCNQAIVRCNNVAELFPHICNDAVTFGGMKMAWIGMLDEATRQVKPVATFGDGVAYLDGLEISVDSNIPAGRGPTGTAIREDRPIWCQDFMHDPKTAHWHEQARRYGWGASASLPLHCNGVVIGAFTLYAGVANAFDESAQNLLVEMALDISFALDRFAREAERKQAVEALRKSEEHLRTIIDTEPECVKVVGKSGTLLEMNAAGLAMLEAATFEQAREKKLLDYILPEYREAFRALHQHVMGGGNGALEFEVMGLHGTRRWLSTTAAPLREANGEISSLLGITRDITQHKEAEQRINYLANFDALTGMPNRAQLDAHIKYALSLAKRTNGQLAVLFIDIDHFKDINDTLGHSIGDAVLIEIAKRLQQILREQDTASRLGGDEFILILPGADALGVAQVAQKLLEVIAQPCQSDRYDLVVTASIGIALYPTDGVDLDTLSRSADTAMYQAKRTGRNSYRFFTAEMQAAANRNMDLVSALRKALERNQLHVHYQPQVSLRDGRIIGAEALLRWRHPELGNISPAEFIPIAEDSGLILTIGEWVMRTAVQQLKAWLASGQAPFVIAVNLSAVQFRHPSLLEMVGRILEEAGLPPQYLELELTEGVAMHDPDGAVAVMNKLHERGVRMSIDDFGTGYSSLNYLKKFKVYKLKIDQSFVRDINSDPEDRAIVSAIISMSRSLNLQTIAEGVETEEQMALLREQGCDEYQGYYFSKPLSVEDFESLMSNRKP